ncbi:MAG: hypothetical protein ACYDH9_18270 [Limisphaerales bacterium]
MNIQTPLRLASVFLSAFVFWMAIAIEARAGSTGSASLGVSIDASGRAQVNVMVTAVLPKPQMLESAVSRALGLKLEDVDLDVEEFKKVVTLSAESANGFPHTLTRVSGQIDLQPLADLLRGVGIQLLSVHIIHPRCPETRCFPARQTVSDPAVEYSYSAVLGATALPRLEFEFGYSSKDLFQVLSPLLLILLLPVAFTLLWRRLPAVTTGEALPGLKSGATRFLFWVGVPTWIVWVVAVYALKGDELTWFVFGCDSVWAQTAAVVGAFVLPSMLAMVASYVVMAGCCQEGAVPELGEPGAGGGGSVSKRFEGGGPAEAGTTNGGGGRAFSLCRMFWSAAGAQAGFVAPVVFLAVGVAMWREGVTGTAREWLGVAAAAVVISIGTRCWAKSGPTGRTLESASGDYDLKRRAVQVWWVSVAVAVLLPALVVRWAEQWRRDDTVRMMIYAGGLVGILVVAGVTDWLMSQVLVRRLQGAPSSGGVHPAPVRSGAGKILLVMQPFVVSGVAFVACELFGLPFDLTRGDEGWGLVLMSFFVAAFQMLLHWRRREPKDIDDRKSK